MPSKIWKTHSSPPRTLHAISEEFRMAITIEEPQI